MSSATGTAEPAGHWNTLDPFTSNDADGGNNAGRPSGSNAPQSDHSDEIEKTETKSDPEEHGTLDKIKTVAKQKFHLEDVKSTGATSFFNPTNVRMRVRWGDEQGKDEASGIPRRDTNNEIGLLWRSRDNRKGRNSIAVPLSTTPDHPFSETPKLTSGYKVVLRNIYRMFTTFPYWDMAFWSGWGYTWGSVLFVLDGIFAWVPVAYGEGVFSANVETYAGPMCFFFGALLYQVGGTIAYLEAVNDGSFHGSAMRRFLEGHSQDQKKMLDDKIGHFFGHLKPIHRHNKDEEAADARHDGIDPEIGWRTRDRRERPGSIYPTGKAPAPRRGALDLGEAEEGESSEYLTWRWYPTWKALQGHHVYEIGYMACAIQLFGVTLYGVTAVVDLPGVLSSLSTSEELGAFWILQVVASSCFLIASLMFTLETQEKWWKPEVRIIGWWIGAWATLGSVGFLLIAVFGILSDKHSWAEYQSDLGTIWGSTGYLISSALQWYEAINKHPVEELFNEPGEMKSFQVHPI